MASSNNKTIPTKLSVAAYIKAIEDPKRRRDCELLKKLMQTTTGKKPVMWGDALVGFGHVKLVSKAGREVEWMQMGFASRKSALSLYLTCDLNQFETFLKKLGKHKRGVGCLSIKSLEDVDMRVLEQMCQKAMKMN